MKFTVAGQPAYAYTGGKPPVPDAPAIVFLHGAQQDHSCWTLQSRWFAHHGHTVLAPDLPGHGRSDGPPLASIEALADWTAALLDAAGLARASLVGHSMGSLIALETALRHPARIERCALLGSALPMPVSDTLLDAARHDEAKAAALINAFSYSPGAQFGGSAVPGLWMTGVNQRLMERQKPGVFHTDLAACNAYARDPASLAGLRCPLLVIAGTRDRMTAPRAARAIADSIPGSRLVNIEGSGHALMAEKPDAVLDALRAFMA